MAKVDILLPYWGEFNLLKQAAESIERQTESDWCLYIVDDCYPNDEAQKYYSSYPDKRVNYIKNKENLGLVKNFNHVLTLTHAKHCVVMGCDDVMLPNYLEVALSKIGDADFYQPTVEVINDNGEVYSPLTDRIKHMLRPARTGNHSGESAVAGLCLGNWLYFPAILWKTAAIKEYGFDEEKPNTQDIYLELTIVKNGGSYYLDNEKTFQYRRSLSSFSSKAKDGTRFSEERRTYKQLEHEFRQVHWRKAALFARLHPTVRLNRWLSLFK